MQTATITPFVFGDNMVRARMDENGSPWFVAKDVCKVLELEKYRDAVARLDEDERGSVLVDTLGGPQEMTTISESGLYALVFRSRKPEARVFSKWVCSEVLPALRRTGSYGMPGAVKASTVSCIAGGPKSEESTDATREFADIFPISSRQFINRACALALQLGVTDVDKMYELYVCYCKIFRTNEPLASRDGVSALEPAGLEYIWNEVRHCGHLSSPKRLQSFLAMVEVAENILSETKSARLEATAKKALQEYVSQVCPRDVPHRIEIAIRAGK